MIDLEKVRRWQCPCPWWPHDSFVGVIVRPALHDGKPIGQRINGVAECPRCGLEWPLIEEPEEWIEDPFRVTCWGPGVAECPECEIVIVDTFDGTYVIE